MGSKFVRSGNILNLLEWKKIKSKVEVFTLYWAELHNLG